MVNSTDVARVAGVSRATVSYVLNDRQDVKITDAVRRRVRAVAHELGYQPSPAARALRTGRGDVVLLLLPEWETTGEVGRFLEETARLVTNQGLACLRYEGAAWRNDLGRLLTLVMAAAVVTFEPLAAVDAKALANAGIPEVQVFILDQPGQPHMTRIGQKDVVAAQMEHLRARGYMSFGYMAAEHPHTEGFQAERIAAFRSMCDDLNLAGSVAVVANDLAVVTATVDDWLRRSSKRLGICAWNDHTAIGILTSARQLGVDVPQRLGVIGCDDTPTARLVVPALSSVRFDLKREAAGVAQQLAAALGRSASENTQHDAEAVEAVPRAST
jgi:DNA-binding LacI/PurR family transcriptional regulator